MTRFIGTETEYGIGTPTRPELSPIITSTHMVVAYAAARGHAVTRTRWDYAPEYPLRDTRGFDLKRYHQVPIVDPNALGTANLITDSGARFYVDHAHPEWAAPESSNAMDAMIRDLAGDVVLREAQEAVATLSAKNESILAGHDPCPALKIYRNNTDGKGQSYGYHENYLYSRDTDFSVLAEALIPFFVTRQIFAGAGRVGCGQRSEKPGFQISQRADFMEQEISLETTMNRGIVNTRDEPHADHEKWRRLHVIIGDANCSQTAGLLKLGMTKLVLDAIEDGVDFGDLKLRDAVRAVRTVSRDLSCRKELPLADGRAMTAVALQREYLRRVTPTTAVDEKVVALLEQILGDLEQDPRLTAGQLDWTAKLAVIQGFVQRGVSWDSPKLQLVDLQYSDIDPAKSLYRKLVTAGRMETLVDDSVIAAAAHQPPTDTRAFFRGMLIRDYGDAILAANWDNVVIDVGCGSPPVRIPMPSVDMFGEDELGDVFASSHCVADVLAKLSL